MKEIKKLNIAILGYGKMGKLIAQFAKERGHNISFIANSSNKDFAASELKESDVAIEFSVPQSAFSNISKCLEANIPVAIGTTGWYNQLDEIIEITKSQNGCILPATNFSVGVNIFFEINKHLATLMDQQPQYDVSITETHHTQKLDAPSGTAITLAEGLLEKLERKNKWSKEIADLKTDLAIKSLRLEDVPGTHDVMYESDIDKITITHEAKNRNGFALGAVLAAEFLVDKKGIYTMRQVLGLK